MGCWFRFVNLMGGHIWIESEGPEKGTTAVFIVKLGICNANPNDLSVKQVASIVNHRSADLHGHRPIFRETGQVAFSSSRYQRSLWTRRDRSSKFLLGFFFFSGKPWSWKKYMLIAAAPLVPKQYCQLLIRENTRMRNVQPSYIVRNLSWNSSRLTFCSVLDCTIQMSVYSYIESSSFLHNRVMSMKLLRCYFYRMFFLIKW